MGVDIYEKDLVHVTVEADRPHDLQSARGRPGELTAKLQASGSRKSQTPI